MFTLATLTSVGLAFNSNQGHPPASRVNTWNFSGSLPQTGILPAGPAVPEPMAEHYVGTIVVPERPNGWPSSTWILKCKRTWNTDIIVGGQNQSDFSFYGWERNDCYDPFGAGVTTNIYFYDPDKLEESYVWQDQLMPCTLTGSGINQWGYMSPIEDNPVINNPTISNLRKAKENGDTSVYIGGTKASWEIYPPHVYEWEDWYGLEPGQEIRFVMYSKWDSLDSEWGFPSNPNHVPAYEIFLNFELEFKWIEVPQ